METKANQKSKVKEKKEVKAEVKEEEKINTRALKVKDLRKLLE